MTKEIVYTDKYALILSDEEIKEGDWFFEKTGRLGPISFSRGKVNFHMKKIIAHLPLSDTPLFESDVPVLEGVPLLPTLPQGEEKFTRLDMIKAFKMGMRGQEFKDHFAEIWDEFVEFIDNPSRPTHFEFEMEAFDKDNNKILIAVFNDDFTAPKTIINSQGQVELLGKYLNK